MVNIVYTNSNCKDVAEVFISQHKKHSPLPLFIISNYQGDYIYKEADPYYKHWVEALREVNDNYFIYNQEDFILYDNINIEKLTHLQKVLESNPQYSFIRLIKSGQNLPDYEVFQNLYSIGYDSFPLYSMQATIWRKDRFIELYNAAKQEKWFECEAYETACRNLRIEGLYYYNNEPRRGGHHDSSIYPYIATAVVRGKWNLKEYKNELEPILQSFNIDPQERGIF